MSTATAYRTLFQDYLGAGLQLVLAQVQAAEPLVPDELRRQAWHLLSYAFESDAAWPLARDLLLALAPKMEQAGFRDEWIAYLEQGLHIAMLRQEQIASAELRLYLGYLCRMLSDYVAAASHFDAAIQVFKSYMLPQKHAAALNHLAHVHLLQHQYPAAESAAHQALALLTVGDPEQATSYSVFGMIHIDHGKWQEAEVYHRRSLEIRQLCGDARKTAWSQQNLAYALRGQGKYDEAIDSFEQASAQLRDQHDPFNAAIVQMNLAATFYLAGAPDKALAHSQHARSTFHRLQSQHHLAILSTNEGLAYLALEQLEEADQAFRISSDLFRAIHDKSGYLNAQDGLCMALFAQTRYREAIEVARRALTELSENTDLPNFVYLQRSLSEHQADAVSALSAAMMNSSQPDHGIRIQS
jgi:tetratricopeptide (TPR) repeat protein